MNNDCRYPKRLIEVDLPIARISAHARREKSIRHGHISTLHIWWARRPLAACRAVICAALWPDPADELCPQAFREAAVEQIKQFASRVFPGKITAEGRLLSSEKHCSPESRARWEAIAAGTLTLDAGEPVDLPILRMCLLDFIADFANWDNSTVPAYLETSRALTQAAHEALGGAPGTRPLVVDPFAGGGSIPLEALRVGADAFASDLNPVAVLLNKVVLEYIPKYGQRLADEVRKWGQWVKEQAEKELAEFYPKDPDGATPIAYFWARQIRCEGPACGALIPLLRSTTLSAKKPVAHVQITASANKDVDILLDDGEEANSTATIHGGKATCPFCGYTTPEKQVKKQTSEVAGGGRTARLYAVLVQKNGTRRFRQPSDCDVEAIQLSRDQFAQIDAKDATRFPKEVINPLRPYKNTVGVCIVTRLGISRFIDLYNERQATSLAKYDDLIEQCAETLSTGELGLDHAITTVLILARDRLVMQNTTLSRWNTARSTIEGLFSKQALQIVWDFVEANPTGDGMANWDGSLAWVLRVIKHILAGLDNCGIVDRQAAQQLALPDDSVDFFFTDPPYFAAIVYGDLSDVFYVWLRRGRHGNDTSLFSEDLVSKEQELVVTNSAVGPNGEKKDETYFHHGMTNALLRGRVVTKSDGLSCVVFADSSTSSWEALLSAVIGGGWTITASWPIDTEMQGRTRARLSASLQSSIFIVCRPRENADGSLREEIGEWRDVLSALPKRIHEWMPRLAAEGVVGADAIFACLGPALEIFSRYSRVEKASGEAVPLREYLEHVWAAVSTEALSMIFKDGGTAASSDAAGLEPDARLTAMWLWMLGAGKDEGGRMKDEEEKVVASTGYTLEFDAARKIAQGLGIHLEQSESIVEVKGDKARLLPCSERTRYLFGKEEAAAGSARGRKKKKIQQRSLFEELDALESEADTAAGELKPQVGETVLDRVHQSMLLFASGRGEALRRFLVDDGAGTDARFWKLAQSLSALYPKDTDEKRWVDGVLARKKGLGL